jgi:hypothetical protein
VGWECQLFLSLECAPAMPFAVMRFCLAVHAYDAEICTQVSGSGIPLCLSGGVACSPPPSNLLFGQVSCQCSPRGLNGVGAVNIG